MEDNKQKGIKMTKKEIGAAWDSIKNAPDKTEFNKYEEEASQIKLTVTPKVSYMDPQHKPTIRTIPCI